MRFTLTIDSENDACLTRHDLSQLISKVAQRVIIADSGEKRFILDTNGNTVGHWKVECDEEEEEDEEAM